MKIGIIGLGVVGKAVKYGLEKKQGHTIFTYTRSDKKTALTHLFKNSEIIFVCVSTPQGKDGSCDISNVVDVCGKLESLAKKGRKKKDIVIKSTLDPRFVKTLPKKYPHLRIAINPEFLKENAAIHDFCNQDVCVIGTTYQDLYDKIVKLHGNLAKEYIKTTPTAASLIKYFNNTFHATRIIFANLFYDLATKLGEDYSEVKSIAVKRYNMIDAYLDCNPNLRGFGGMCLPKDTSAIQALCRDLNLEYNLFAAILKDNKRLNNMFPDEEAL
jgi:nucleotide sugar dehydrogenase